MKKLLVFLFLMPFVLYSQTPQQKIKAKLLIQKYMNENLNDIQSYAPVQTTFEIDSSRFKGSIEEGKLENRLNELYADLENWKEVERKSTILRDNYNDTSFKISPENARAKSDSIRNDIKTTSNELNEKRIKYKPVLIGFIGTHKFRAKNAMGGVILREWYFLFDPKFITIFNVSETFENVDSGLF